MDTPDTPEDQIRATLFAGLKQVILTLKPGDIHIEENRESLHPIEQELAQEHMEYITQQHDDLSGSTNVATTITIPGHAMGEHRMKALKTLMETATGTFHSYGSQHVTFHGTMNALAQLLDRTELIRQVKENIPPMGRTAG